MIIDGKCPYEEFLKDAKKKFHIDDSKKLNFKENLDELDELEAIIEDIALNNPVLPKCHKPLKSVSRSIKYQAHEIRTRKSMLRVYYIKEKRTGKIIILGHIKGNKKDQQRELKKVVRIAREYYEYTVRNKVKIIR